MPFLPDPRGFCLSSGMTMRRPTIEGEFQVAVSVAPAIGGGGINRDNICGPDIIQIFAWLSTPTNTMPPRGIKKWNCG
jgi:hypothetical protein